MAETRPVTVILHDGQAQGDVFDQREGRTLTYNGQPLAIGL